MDSLLHSAKARTEKVLHELNGPHGPRSTIGSLQRKVSEAGRRRAIRRARATLHRLQGQLNETVAAVGIEAVALHEAGTLVSPELAPLCQHVLEIRASLAEQKEALARLEAPRTGPEVAQGGVCDACGQPLPLAGLFCPYCGTAIPGQSGAAYCAQCGSALRPGSKFCPHCGQAVPG